VTKLVTSTRRGRPKLDDQKAFKSGGTCRLQAGLDVGKGDRAVVKRN
jgi:hypothetical protein